MNKYMNKYIVRLAIIARVFITVVVAFTGGAIAQSTDSKKVETGTSTAASNVQTVDARQSGAWTVGVDPARNVVKVLTSPEDPINVRVIRTEAARVPFQKALTITAAAGSANLGNIPIPEGKRLVIENISFSGDCPEGQKIYAEFRTYLDNGDGSFDSLDSTTHRLDVSDQGVFHIGSHFAANHRVLVFADSQIETTTVGIDVIVRVSAGAGNAIGRFTITGYLEDLPALP